MRHQEYLRVETPWCIFNETALTHLLFVVWNDASDEVGVGVVEGGHEFAELLLVQLPHGAEHALPGASTERRLIGRLSTHADDLG